MAFDNTTSTFDSPRLYLVTLLLAGLCHSPTWAGDEAARDSSTFKVFEENGKYGFQDSSGNVVIPAQFDSVAEQFAEGVCVAKTRAHYGFIDERGRYVIEAKFASADSFHEGAACVLDADDGKWGFIDHQGDWLFERKFDASGAMFTEGLSPVKLGNKWGFVDRMGTEVIQAEFYFAKGFSEGLAAVQVADEFGTWGYINWKGEWVIRPRFTAASPFYNGKASVSISETKRHVIDRRGRVVK